MLTQEQIVEVARKVLAQNPKVRLGLLFGSVARGQARPDSDVDVALAGEKLDVLAVGAELSAALGVEVDVVELTGETPIPLLRELMREGICIYESAEGAFADWKLVACWRLEDEGPLFDRTARAWLKRVAEQGLK